MPYIANVAVQPRFRRQGAARQLLDHAEEFAKVMPALMIASAPLPVRPGRSHERSSRLMLELAAQGMGIGGRAVWLEVTKDNVAAVELYRKRGYLVISENEAEEVERNTMGYRFRRVRRLTLNKMLE